MKLRVELLESGSAAEAVANQLLFWTIAEFRPTKKLV
jgi:hypothetical protein